MRAQALITDQEFTRQRKIMADQRSALQSRSTGQSVDVAEIREHFKEISMPLVQLRHTWETIHPAFRRRFDRLVVPTGFVIGQSRTADLGGLFSFIRGFADADSSVVPQRRIEPAANGSPAVSQNHRRCIPERQVFHSSGHFHVPVSSIPWIWTTATFRNSFSYGRRNSRRRFLRRTHGSAPPKSWSSTAFSFRRFRNSVANRLASNVTI